MNNFRNEPNMTGTDGEGKIKRYVHSPLAIEHYGIHASIQSNGKVVLSANATKEGEEIVYDEIEIPASLVFKLASLLKATRKIEYVSLSEANSSRSAAVADSVKA